MIIRITKLKIFTAVLSLFLVALTVAVATDTVSVVQSAGETGTPLPIVMYHQTTTKAGRAGRYVITAEQLEKDFAYIRTCGYESITVEELLDHVNYGAQIPDKPIMITFDDGYETVYELVLPLLEKYKLKAVVSIIGSATDLFTEKGDHNTSYSHLCWEEIDLLVQSEYVEIQCHSYDMHKTRNGRKGMRKKSGESLENYKKVLSDDLNLFRDKLLDNTNYEARAVAYPFGEYSKETPDILRGLGFDAAFICEEKLNYIDLNTAGSWIYRLRRFNRASGKSSEDFFAKLGVQPEKSE